MRIIKRVNPLAIPRPFLRSKFCRFVAKNNVRDQTRRSRQISRRLPLCVISLALLFATLPGNLAAVEFEPGENIVSETIVIGLKAGNRIAGQAAAQMVNNASRGDAATWIAWDGPEAGPVVRILGTESVLENISIHGADWLDYKAGDPKVDAGVFIQRVGQGLPTGRVKALNVNIAHAKVGLQIGENVHDAQCAECDWRSIWFEGCDTAVRMVPAMALGHYFSMVRANGCQTVFLIEGGGKLLVDGLFTATADTTLVKLRPQRGGVAHNNASYEFRHVFLDRQAESTVILDMADWNYSGSLVFNRGKISYKGERQPDGGRTGYGGPAFKLAGNASVAIRDYEHLQSGMIEWNNARYTTRLLIENSCIIGDAKSLFNETASIGKLRVILRDCYNDTGEPIPDFAKVLTGAKKADDPAARAPKSSQTSLGVERLQRGPHIPQGVRHAGMPRGSAGHLRRMVGDEHAVVPVGLENSQYAEHVDVAVVDECLVVPRGLAVDVPQVDVGNLSLPAVLVDRLIHVPLGHLGERADAELQRIGRAWPAINQLLVKLRPIDQPGVPAHRGRRRIVRMSRELHAGLLSDGNQLVEKIAEPLPQGLAARGRMEPLVGVGVVRHVPDHAARHRHIARAVHADRQRPAACGMSCDPPAHARDAEVVAHHRNARLAQAADDRLEVLKLPLLLRAVEQHVVPVGGVEVLDRLQRKPLGVDRPLQIDEFLQRPDLIRIAGIAPTALRAGRLVVVRAVASALKVVDKMHHQVRSAGLPRELKVLASQHMPI
jgi:hypothetical protein